MTTAFRWADHVSVRARYQRSVHLERDAGQRTWLKGYVVTPLVRSIVDRMARGLSAGGTARAWSLTGPYGSGKSAFALFLSHLLGVPSTPASAAARTLLAHHDAPLRSRLWGANGVLGKEEGLWPVLATGERRPVDEVLLRALESSVLSFWSGPGAKPEVVKHVAEAATRASAGRAVSAREIVELFGHVAEKVSRSSQRGRGLLVILDEAGKVLEHAAHNPARGDISLVQELAECANRSGDVPIVFCVVLHQAFEQYAGRLSAAQRNEWARVQGRFEDLPFQEATDQVVRLIGSALEQRELPSGVARSISRAVADTIAVARGSELDQQADLAQLLASAAPLHPATALLLGPLFRSRIAQNERSLFAFLAATEPNGFQQFLREERAPDSANLLFPVDRLYDYLLSTYGARLYGQHGHQWAQVDTALHRLPKDAGELDARIVKAIGVLGAVGEAAGLVPSEAVLIAALGDGSSAFAERIRQALRRLTAASVVVYRKYRDAYQLWEGSDLNIDALVSEAMGHIDPRKSLIDRLMRIAPPRPLVARRHLFETGTLRYFEVRYADEEAADGDLAPRDKAADGVVWLVVPSSDQARDVAWAQISQPMRWIQDGTRASRPCIVAVARDCERLREVALELAALEWVQTHTPALHDDPVARRELLGRIGEAERLLRAEVSRLLGGPACDWIYRAERLEVRSPRDLTRLLSNVCRETYDRAPHIQNELLNRRQLSSASAAARRELLQAMLAHQDKKQLGLEGFPPEVSMYRSLLAAHKLHVEIGDHWELAAPPTSRKRGSLRPAWDALQSALSQNETDGVSLHALYGLLRRPPFGIKDGVIPVIVMVAMEALEHEVALFEDGEFVSAVTSPVVERILRSPDRFVLRRFATTDEHAELLDRLTRACTTAAGPRAGLVAAARALERLVADLPEYARNTETLSPAARAVREALRVVLDPASLLLRALPEACGTEPFHDHRPTDAEVGAFLACLDAALSELRSAYPRLLNAVSGALSVAFQLPSELEVMRPALTSRATAIGKLGFDSETQTFVVRVTDESLDRDSWLVSVATVLADRPPEVWHDLDVDQVRARLAVIASRFDELAPLARPKPAPKPITPGSVRIAVTQLGCEPRVHVGEIREEHVAKLEDLRRLLREEIAAARERDKLSLRTLLGGLGLVMSDLIGEPRPDAASPDLPS